MSGRRGLTAGISLAGMLLAVHPAGAADNDTLKFFAEEAEVMAAAKHPQKVCEAPAATQIISAQDIARYGYRTLAEALQSVPGIYATNDRNYTYLWVRGFGRPSDYNDRILLLINDHRMNDNVYGQAFVGFDFSLDMAAVERIEVVKGPGAALYGNNAFLAVVNVITKTARNSPPARASAELGSYHTHKEFLELSRRFKDGWGAYGSGFYRYMGGQDLSYPAFNVTNHGTATNADREESYAFYGIFTAPGWQLQGNVNNRYRRVPTASFGTVFANNGTYTTDSRSFLELAAQERKVRDDLSLTGRVYYDWYGYHGNYVYTNTAPPPDLTVNKDWSKSAWYGEELRAKLTPLGERNALLVGEEFEKNLLGRQGNYNEAPHALVLDDNRTEYRWGLFAQQEIRPHPRLGLTLGLRNDWYQSFGNIFRPRGALVYQPWQESSVKLLYGEAFRAPNLYERFYTASGNLANPGLRPERIRTYEAVWEQGFGPRGSASLSCFHSRITDLINQQTLPGGAIQYANTQKARTFGAELAGKADLTDDLSARLSYSLQSTRFKNGDRLSNSPTHVGNLGLSRRLAPWKARLSAEGFLISARTTTKGTTLPATALLSLTARLQPWRENLTLFAGVFNVLDAGYSISGAAEHTQTEIPQNGRNFNLGAEYRFGASVARP